MKNRMPYNTEEGFFEEMQRNLLDIPERVGERKLRLWEGKRHRGEMNGQGKQVQASYRTPAFSWRMAGTATAALAMVTLLAFVFFRPSFQAVPSAKDETFGTDTSVSADQTEQIEEYLVDSGLSVYQLAEYKE